MIPYLDCRAAQEMLEPFVDGELAVNDQVALESHLRWCRVCAVRVEDMQLIGASLRVTSCALRAADEADDSLTSVRSEVLTRIQTEREQSMWTQLHGMCDDMRFFWPAIGASFALAACLFVAVTVVSLTSDENPDSLAGMIQLLANPGSDANPMRLDGAMAAPPRSLGRAGLESVPGDDDEAVFALAAVVTREGRVANYEVLFSERASVRRHDTAVQTGDVSSVVNAVKQTLRLPRSPRRHRRPDPPSRGVPYRFGGAGPPSRGVPYRFGGAGPPSPGAPYRFGGAGGGVGMSPRALAMLLSASVARMITPRVPGSPSRTRSNCSSRESGIPSFG